MIASLDPASYRLSVAHDDYEIEPAALKGYRAIKPEATVDYVGRRTVPVTDEYLPLVASLSAASHIGRPGSTRSAGR